MPKQLTTTVIFNEDQSEVLLFERGDFRLWTMPGGFIEPGEKPENAAVRETEEETGYIIEVIRLVGTYHRPQMNDLRYLFLGKVIGGEAIKNGPETRQVAWFPINSIPENLTPSISEFIQDTLSNTENPIEKVQTFPLSYITKFRTLIKLRDFYNWITRRPKS